MSEVKLPDPMTYCKARMVDASLYGRNLESEMFGKIVDELARHNALVVAVAWLRECSEFHNDKAVFYLDTWWEYEVFNSLKAARAEVDRILATQTEL